MKIVIGNKTLDFSKEEFIQKALEFNRIILDIGTGDGNFVYKNALENPNNLYIGIDPAEKQLMQFSRKIQRNKLANALLLVANIDNLFDEIFGQDNIPSLLDEIYINFPWGSLLKKVIKPSDKMIKTLYQSLKSNGKIELIFGYSPTLEPSETQRLDLPLINKYFIENGIIQTYETHGFFKENVEIVDIHELTNVKSSWGRKIRSNEKRQFYRIVFTKK